MNAHAQGESKAAVVSAVVGNLMIAVVKFAAAFFSSSAAMLAEAIHSLADTSIDGLLLYGLRRSAREPDHEHPFGYGREVYFWTAVAGMIFFALGGGMSIVTGLHQVVAPAKTAPSAWTYAVLGAAALFEGTSWLFGYRAFRKEQRGRGVLETIRRTKNPLSFTVLLEDSAALIGIALAFAGIYAADRFDAPWLDGAASVAIGVLLCSTALLMVYESKELLIGEGMERKTLAALREIALAQPDVEDVGGITTLYLGPGEAVLALEVRFRDGTPIERIRHSLALLREAVLARYPQIRRIFIETTSIGEEK